MQDYELMLKAYSQAGGNPEVFNNSKIAHLVIHKNKVIGKHLIDSLILEPKETEKGVDVYLEVIKGVKIDKPVHLCFGILPKEAEQIINIKAKINDGSGIRLLAHCVFPEALNVVHKMQAEIEIGDDAFYEYNEVHFHGEGGGITVLPEAKIKLGNNSRYIGNFSLLKGRVGAFDLNYQVEALENSVVELNAKIYGYKEDKIKLREVAFLNGKGSRGLIKSRVAVKDDAESEIISELTASAPEANGHVDCVEIIQGNAKAKAIPIVNVTNELAKVTHEAAIGKVDKKQLETLMARGLTEEEAVYIVVSGILK